MTTVGELGVVPDLTPVDREPRDLHAELAPVARRPRRRRLEGEGHERGGEHDLRIGGAELLVRLEGVDEGAQPVPVRHRVVVEQGHVVDPAEILEPEVAATGKPGVVGVLDHVHPGHLAADTGCDAVDRRVVDEEDVERVLRPVDVVQRFEAPQGHVAAVVVQYHDTHARSTGHHREAGRGADRWSTEMCTGNSTEPNARFGSLTWKR